MKKSLIIAKAILNELYKNYGSDSTYVSKSNVVYILKRKGVIDVEMEVDLDLDVYEEIEEELDLAFSIANKIHGRDIINYADAFHRDGFLLIRGYNRADLKNLYTKIEMASKLSWQIVQNIFFSMVADKPQLNYYDTSIGDVVGYMDEYLVPLSQSQAESFKICMARALRMEPPDQIDPNIHRQIPILRNSILFNTTEAVISQKKKYRFVREAFDKTVLSFQIEDNDFLKLNFKTKSFKSFFERFLNEVSTNKIGDMNLLNQIYKETAETIVYNFVWNE